MHTEATYLMYVMGIDDLDEMLAAAKYLDDNPTLEWLSIKENN